MRVQIKYILVCAILISVVGTLLHFLYDFTGQNYFAGLISPTSESTWEHMKLVFFPMVVGNIWLYRKLKSIDGVNPEGSLLAGTLLGTWLIPILFYSYKGILGFSTTALDIATFYISVILAYLFIWHTYSAKWKRNCLNTLFILCILQLLAFMYFSYRPGTIGIMDTFP